VANIACWRKRRLRDPLLRRLWLVSKRLLAGTDSVNACALALARDIKINVPWTKLTFRSDVPSALVRPRVRNSFPGHHSRRPEPAPAAFLES
jgi:hypothetical protein